MYLNLSFENSLSGICAQGHSQQFLNTVGLMVPPGGGAWEEQKVDTGS